ncbi:MAG: sugar transferase, partial [Leptotrichia sp.]|nr:sugar transferase [Leptotrichia sp.]
MGNRKMAMSGVRKNFSYLFGILTVAMYFIGLIIINRGLGFRNAMIIVSALIAYYIANVYNVATNKYKLKDMTTVIVINGILMTVTTFSKIFTFYEGIVLFGIITIFQIAFRYIVIMGVVEKERVVFVGENDYTEDLLESVKKDGQYVFVTSLNNTDMKALGKEILELYNTKKFDVLVDFTDKLLRDPKITEKLLQYKLEGLQYYNYLEFYETYENKLPISHLSPKWFLENTGFEIYHNNFNLKAKRLLDLLFALLIGIFAAPVIVLAAIIV